MLQTNPAIVLIGISLIALASISEARADWKDWLNTLTTNEDAKAAVSNVLSESEIADGLRAALGKGVRNAVSELGREGGFLANTAVKIPVPEHLKLVESGLRKIGKGEIADQFLTSMNRAAERAVPEAAEVFAGAISNMTISDARGILDGGETAATDYLRSTSNDELKGRFAPLVDAAVREAGATKYYQAMLDKAGPVASLIDSDKLDLSNYVTDGALDGLYKILGNEEQKIRADPAARTSDLLKKVFGS